MWGKEVGDGIFLGKKFNSMMKMEGMICAISNTAIWYDDGV